MPFDVNINTASQSRQVKGLLNRLSNLNFLPIISSFVELYSQYPRHELTNLISEQILSSIIETPNVLDQFILQYSSLVVVLSSTGIIGVDFGTYFVASLMGKLKQLSSVKATSIALTTMLAQLYSLQLINEMLILEFGKFLLSPSSFIEDNEIRVEVLLRLITSINYF